MSTIINAVNNSSYPVYIAGPILLSSSDLANLSTVGKLLIAAPGANFANIPFFAMCESSAGTGYSGSSTVGFANGSNTNITGSTLFLALAGVTELNSTNIVVNGATVATYTNLNNQATYLFGGSIAAGGTQTVQVWIKYFILPLV
jgi:hypothetical protein